MSDSEFGGRFAAAAEEVAEGSGRRQFIKGAAATAAATAAVAAAGDLLPAPAQAADRLGVPKSLFPFPLPPVGVEIPCSCYAVNVPLQINTGIVNLDFKGGIRVRVETSDTDGLRLSIVGHKVTGTIPNQLSVTIEQADTELTPLSVLYIPRGSRSRGERAALPTPTPNPQMLMYLDFTLTVEWLDGSGKPPLTVSTLEPAKLLATNVTQFPPSNLTYNLQAPVKLGAPGSDPADAPVTLQGFPVTVNQAP